MSGLPFSWLKRVAGAVVGQEGVSRRVSGRGMGLQCRGLVAPSLLVSYCPLASLQNNLAARRGFALWSEAVARLDCQERALCCWTAAVASYGCARRDG